MVRLYTNKHYLNIPVIDKNNSYFMVKVGASGITDAGIECIRKVDNAELIDRSIGTVSTPFGVTGVDNLSTGCQTLLNLLYVRDNHLNVGVDVTGCGTNALDIAFEIADGTDIPLVLRYLSVSKCKNRNYIVNDRGKADNVFDLVVLLEQSLNTKEGI